MPMRILLIILLSLPILSSYISADQEQVNIGISLSLTGKYASFGRMQKNSYDLWQDTVNSKGGLLGRKVSLIIVDDQSSEENAKANYPTLIEKDHVDLVIGPYSSIICEAIMPIVEKHKYPTLLPAGSADQIWEHGFQYGFGLTPPASKYTVGFLELLVHYKYKRIAILNADDSFSITLARNTQKWAKRLALEIVYLNEFKKGTKDLLPFSRDIQKSEPDALIVCGHLDESVNMRKALKQSNWYPKAFYASVGPALTEFHDILGIDAELTFSSSYWEADVSDKYVFSKEFAQLFTERYKEQPSYHAANAYAACMIIEQAVERTKSLDREKLRQVFQTMNTLTLIGYYGVDKSGKQIRQFPMIIQWQKDKKEVVWPMEIQTVAPVFSR
jgi:branched-chain amino acid transport system substrate-binding protein